METLYELSCELNGARKMLARLLDEYDIVWKQKRDKNDRVYTKAELELILSSKDNMFRFLSGQKPIFYRNPVRDKKGKLIKVEAYYESRK